MSAQAYPLQWPRQRPRTRYRKRAPFHRRVSVKSSYSENWYKEKQSLTIADSRDRVLRELKIMGASAIVISSNLVLREDGLPRSNQREPEDPGVAVYFQIGKQPHCLSCDSWMKSADNLAAIAKHVEAMRGQLRWGVANVAEMFSGFKSLPPSGPSHETIKTVEDAAHFVNSVNGAVLDERTIISDAAIAREVSREAARKLHPDTNQGRHLNEWQMLQAAKTLLDAHHGVGQQ